MKTALVISFSDLAADPRVDRQIVALRTRYRVVAAGLRPSSRDGTEFHDIRMTRRSPGGRALGLANRLARRHDAVYWTPPVEAVAAKLRAIRADVVVANDIRTLPIALSLGAPVVFDAHEYAPEQFADELWWRVVERPWLRRLCRRYIPQAATMTTVGGGLADAYERETGVRPRVVTNAPPYAALEPTPVHDPVRILHHGGAQRGRGLEDMVRLAALLDDRFTVDFVLVEATPGFRERLVELARPNPRVRFPPPRPMRELPQMANEYDVGLFLLPPNNLNRRFVLPNKFFEFVQGRLGIAIGPSPEMAALVRRYGLGVVAADFAAESLAAELNKLDASRIAAFKAAAHAAAPELCAERNAETLLRAVEDALARRARPAARETR